MAHLRTASSKKVHTESSEACKWIQDMPEYRDWKKSRVGALLALLGDMGCGKTAVTSYLECEARDDPAPTAVLSFHCSAQESMPLCNVYKGLIFQLLQNRPWLRSSFKKWIELISSNRKATRDDLDALENADLLGKFLNDNITVPDRELWTIIFLDGLDEMDKDSRQDLLKLMQTLLRDNAHLKVFLTSQHREDIDETLRGFQESSTTTQYNFTMGYIEMRPDLERDRILAEHLVSAIWLPDADDFLKREVVEQLARMANGSAIWLQMATARLKFQLIGIWDEKGVDTFMKLLETAPTLDQLYSELFVTKIPTSEDFDIARQLAEAALENLSVARRPLSIGELTFAVFLDQPDINRLETLNRRLRASTTVLDYIRPFVSEHAATGRYSLVHQSLVELILRRPPSQWQSLTKGPAANYNDVEGLERRRGGLQAAMLSRCIKYIMFDEFQEKDLAAQLREPEAEDKTLEFFHSFQLSDEPDSIKDSDSKRDTGTYIPLTFDPEACGFGTFFAYAAAYWPDHFARTPLKLRPEASTIVQLCGHQTQRLSNWVEMWKKPSCRFADEHPDADIAKLDPLVAMAYIDPTAATLSWIAQEKKTHPQAFCEFSEWNMMEALAPRVPGGIQSHRLSVIRQVLDDPLLGPGLCEPRIFIWLLRDLGSRESGYPADWPGSQWEDIFRAIIKKLGLKLQPEVHFTLRLACKQGWLTLVKLLFEAGDEWPPLKAEMLSARAPRADEESKTSLAVHQSVGEAAYHGHADIVRFLCQQKGIEPHLKYVNANGYNVFHQCQRFDQSEILETLIPLWPEGVYQKNNQGNTPLDLLLFSYPFSTETSAETVSLKTLLRLGKYDPKMLGGGPMDVAVKKANTMVCRMLVEYGADPRRVVQVGSDGVPKLRADLMVFADRPEVVGRVLRCFCDLAHLPVPEEYQVKAPIQAHQN